MSYYCDLSKLQCNPASTETYGMYESAQYTFRNAQECQAACTPSLHNCQNFLQSITDFSSPSIGVFAGYQSQVCAPFTNGPNAPFRVTRNPGTGRYELIHNSHSYQEAINLEDQGVGVMNL